MADCTNCGTGVAVLSYGTTIEAQDPDTQLWVLICGMSNLSGPSAQRGEIDTTTLCSTAKENVLDLPDYGTIEMSGQLMDGNEGQILLDALFISAKQTQFRILFPDDAYGNGAVIRQFTARVQSMPVTAQQGAVLGITATLRVTGPVTKTLPTAMGPHLTYTPTVLAESTKNDGTVAGVVSIVLAGDTFADPLAGVTFGGVPAGLSAQAARISPNTAIVNFTGAATSHIAGTKAAVTVTFADAAFATLPAAQVAGATGRQITINFV